MDINRPPQPNIVEREEYKPKYLQQIKLLQELTGTDENDILDTAKPQIGRKIGNRDHTTILGVLKKIEQFRREGNPKEGVTAEEFNTEIETLWEKAVSEFETFVRQENKQINQAVDEPLQNP